MTCTARRLQLVFLSTVILFAVASSVHAQRKPKIPPGVDYPRDNVTSGYRVDAAWPKGKSSFRWKAKKRVGVLGFV